MQFIFDALTNWIKDFLIGSITNNLNGMFADVNSRVGGIADQVGQTPQGWNPDIFSMVKNLSQTVIVPIAGMILTFVVCYELISMIVERNNMHEGVCCKRCISNTSNITRMTVGTFMVICLNYCVKSGDVLTD